MSTSRLHWRRNFAASILGILILSLASNPQRTHAGHPRYTITGLGSPPSGHPFGHISSSAKLINNQGQVAGSYAQFSADQSYVIRDFVFSNDVFTTIPIFPSFNSVSLTPLSMDDSGRVLIRGIASDSQFSLHEKCGLWDGNTFTDFGNLGTNSLGYGDTTCGSINNSGQGVASSRVYNAAGIQTGNGALLYDNNQVKQIGPFAVDSFGQTYTSAQLGADGVIFGSYGKSPSSALTRLQPFMLKNGLKTDLSGFDHDNRGLANATISGSNDLNQIVGKMDQYDQVGRLIGGSAYVWKNGTVTVLASATGSRSFGATQINNRGEVLGTFSDGIVGAGQGSFFWDGSLHLIPSLGTDETGYGVNIPIALNLSGQAIGTYKKYVTRNGQRESTHQGVWFWENGQVTGLDLGIGDFASTFWDLLTDDRAFGSYGIYSASGTFIRSSAFTYNAADGFAQMDGLIDNFQASGWLGIDHIYGSNDLGQLVGSGPNSHGDPEAFVLSPISPVPEPLATTGVFLIAVCLRRSKRCLHPNQHPCLTRQFPYNAGLYANDQSAHQEAPPCPWPH